MNETRQAQPPETRPVELPLATPRIPADLFAFIGDWQRVGTSVERESSRGTVRVSTFVDSGDNPRWKAVCSEFPFINDEPVDARNDGDVYDRIIASADDFIDDNQGDLFESHGVRR